VITKANAPRSYIVETATGRKRRNRHHLAPRLQSGRNNNNEHFRFDTSVSPTVSPESLPVAEPHIETPRSPIRTRSMTGTANPANILKRGDVEWTELANAYTPLILYHARP